MGIGSRERGRGPAGWVCVALVVAVASATAGTARAFDFLDGKIEAHGYFESQIRGISDDFGSTFDLTQWYNILNVEIDLNIAPGGFGPFDSVTGFIRAEVRYDCVWTRACGLSHSTDVFGDRSEFLPQRLSQSLDPGFSGTTRATDPAFRQPFGRIATEQVYPADPANMLPNQVVVPFRGFNVVPSIDTLYGVRAIVNGVDYFPALYTFQRFNSYGFALRNIRGTEDLFGTQVMPWDPKDDIDPFSTLRDRVNPFNPNERNPETGLAGATNLPYRPAPNFLANQGPDDQAQGIYYPSPAYARYIRDGGSDRFQQNFSQEELAWNRGASQTQTKELKEAYLDIDMLVGRLFIRLGRQAIVWGKTELFATTDQFNPTDLALASLPRLEESRIPVWALRAIYSFYEVGPLQDVRLELAMDLDTFYPADIGRCGEPYTPNPACNKTFGLLGHGISGLGIAGEDRPPNWWESSEGIQAGVRVEFRWERFSFALVDFWNYEKLPYSKRLTTYARNVDPQTGRPRRMGATGSCTTGAEPSCLQPGNDALQNTSVNQQYFSFVCSASVGFNSLDRSVCAQSVLTSQAFTALPFASVAQLLSLLYAGAPQGIAVVSNPSFIGTDSRAPLVSLSIDPADAAKNGSAAAGPTGFFAASALNPVLNFALPGFAANHNQFQTTAQVLSVQQQALLGCGPFYGTSCDGGANQVSNTAAPGGIDLMNAEASALVQSWLGFDGSTVAGIPATDASVAQPGTVGFRGGPICTRVLPDGSVGMLPGCRGPGDPGYDPAVDGGDPSAVSIGFPAGIGPVPGLGNPALGPIAFTQGHPFTGQTWRSEMAALSWNLQAVLVAFSDRRGDPGVPDQLGFDPSDAYRTDGCSFAAPWYCSAVSALWAVIGNQRNDLKAAGNVRFGRRDFVWHGGGEVVLSYQRRNTLGFSVDFAEDTTKSNWSLEFTWVNRQPFDDGNQFDGITRSSTYNLTVSVDRPTFVNFLNESRTFFINSQWFFQYIPDYRRSFADNGPWETLFTFTVNTGYFQDRLLPSMTWVYDVQSNSGAVLPQISYRFTESVQLTFGMALFWGRYQAKTYPIAPVSLPNQVGRRAYTLWQENGLSVIRQRDEAFMILRWTF